MTYLAHDTNLDAKVAIKEYLPRDLAARDHLSPNVRARAEDKRDHYQRGLERFLLESRTLAAFRHPNIVRVNRFFEANNSAYMVMDYELGEGLDAWMKKRVVQNAPAPDEKTLLRMVVPLLQGVERVHEAGFLHRDIKPANIYVRNRDGSLVLLDFGAARQTSALAVAGMTSIFSPGYSPFEQYHRHGPQGPWSDLYAMGSVLYWFVTGQRPVDAAARVQRDPLEPVAKLARGKYSQGFLQAIDWALTLDEKSRPQSVAEFLPVLAGETGAMGWFRKKLGMSAVSGRSGGESS
jgi:serine/threonine protein kinase